MRLRVEKIEDETLRAQFISDLAGMQHLVREGLDLARIETTVEAVTPVDLDALLSAICEDAAEAGQPVVFTQGCNAVVPTRPQALRRCLTNLVDNAVRHGGDAAVLHQHRQVFDESVRRQHAGIAQGGGGAHGIHTVSVTLLRCGGTSGLWPRRNASALIAR